MENPRISIIVPCYNGEKYLRETLDCLKKQTIEDWECVIVNDGSCDNSALIAEEFSKADARYIVINQCNQGPSAARNKGLSCAKGKYICVLDSDDIIDAHYLSTAVDYLEKHDDCSLVYCYGDFFGSVTGKMEQSLYVGYKELLLVNSLFNAFVFRIKDFERIGGYDESMKGYEDWDYVIRLLYHNDIVYQIPKYWFHYRKHSEGNSVNDNAQKRHIELCDKIYCKNSAIYIEFFGSPYSNLLKIRRYEQILKIHECWNERIVVRAVNKALRMVDKIVQLLKI